MQGVSTFFLARVSAALLASLLCLPSVADALGKREILAPYKNDLTQCIAALEELERQAGLHLQELEQRLAVLDARRQDLEKAADRLRQHAAVRKESLDRAVLAGWQLINEIDDTFHLPGYGFVTIQTLRERRETETQEMEQQAQALAAGEVQLQVPGLGLLSRKELEERIHLQQVEIVEFKTMLEAGEYRIHYPGLGEVDRNALQAHKEFLEERMATVAAQIDSGEYVMVLPHLGALSKNDLDARIAQLNETIKNLKQSFKDGREQILRANMQWSDATELAAVVKDLEEQKAVLRQTLKEQNAEFLLPTGWRSEQTLAKHIQELQAARKQVETDLANKAYKVVLHDGNWANEKDLDKALRNAIIAPEIRRSLERGRSSIAVTAELEITQRQILSELLEQWRKNFSDLAASQFALLDLELQWKRKMLEEFRREETEALRWLQERQNWLQRIKRSFP